MFAAAAATTGEQYISSTVVTLCAQLTRDRLAITKFLFSGQKVSRNRKKLKQTTATFKRYLKTFIFQL